MSRLAATEGSQVSLKEDGLTIHLELKLLAPLLWEQIRAWFSGQGEQDWLRAPFAVMSAEGSEAGRPRWKQIRVDGLSWLIFVLLVPSHHPLVALWQVIDWAQINQLCQAGYQNSERGQRAWAPAQMFALLVLLLVVPVSSETGLLQTVAISPLYRWFCGFGLFSKLPDHSSLYTFRQRLGVERFEAILTWTVGQCQQQGLIGNELLLFDMMGVAAAAHVWSPYERAVLLTQALIRYLELARQNQSEMGWEGLRQLAAEMAIEVLDNKSLKKGSQVSQRVLNSVARWQQKRQAASGKALWEISLEEAVQTLLEQDRLSEPVSASERHRLKKVAQALKARLPHSRGDLDARVGWVSNVLLKCGYWVGFLADSVCHVITAVRVVPLNVSQHYQMIPALDTHQQRCGHYPQAVAADSAQDYYPVHAALDQLEIEGHIASREHLAVGGGLGAKHFTWNESGQLICPVGIVMTLGQPRKSDGLVPGKATGQCAICSYKDDCLPKGQQPDGPRVIHLDPPAHQRWLHNREHCQSEVYKQAQAKRFTSEGLFGLARRLHRADKMPYRSQPMNHIAGVLLATVMNLALLARP